MLIFAAFFSCVLFIPISVGLGAVLRNIVRYFWSDVEIWWLIDSWMCSVITVTYLCLDERVCNGVVLKAYKQLITLFVALFMWIVSTKLLV